MSNSRFIKPLLLALLCIGALMNAFAWAAPQSTGTSPNKLYKWVDDQGKVHYTERLPQEATGKATATLNRQGTVIKESDRALTKEELHAREEIERKREEEAKRTTEERRKNEALLSSYESEKDIEAARTRAMESNADVIKSTTHNVNVALKKQAELNQQAAGYKGKKLPMKLQRDIDSNDVDLKAQQQLLDMKKKEAAQINARYDEDKRRFRSLKGGTPATPATASVPTTAAAR